MNMNALIFKNEFIRNLNQIIANNYNNYGIGDFIHFSLILMYNLHKNLGLSNCIYKLNTFYMCEGKVKA